MPWPVDLDRVIAREQVGAVGPCAGPHRSCPPDQPEAVIAAEKQVVRNVEVTGAGILGPYSESDLLKAAVLDRQSYRAEHLLLAGEDGHIGVANRQSLEDVIPRRHDVEQPVIAGPVEDHLPIAGRLDRDRLLSAFLSTSTTLCHRRASSSGPRSSAARACRARHASGSYHPAAPGVPRQHSSRPTPRRSMPARGS